MTVVRASVYYSGMKQNDLIRSARKSTGMTQAQMAQAIGVVEKTVQRWELGYTVPPLSGLRSLAEVTGTPILEFIEAEPVQHAK